MKTTVIRLLCMMGPVAALAAPASPCDAALEAAEQWASARGWRAEVTCRALASQARSAGKTGVALPLPTTEPVRSGSVTWPIRVEGAGTRTTIQRVPLTVRWWAPAWVTQRDLAAGAELKPEDVAVELTRWPDGMVVTAADAHKTPVGRLRAALRAGSLLTGTALMPPDSALRGDPVTTVLAQGGLELRLPGQLVSGARVGERVKVQLSGRTAAIEGVLADLRTVVVLTE